MADDYDNPWKEATVRFFPDCVRKLFPQVYALVDWAREYEVIQNDLPILGIDGKTSKRNVDVLVKVWMLDGKQKLLYLHLEIQFRYEKDFARRVLIYWTRVMEKYNTVPISLVILIDGHKNWRPDRLKVSNGGLKLYFEYPMVKLLDWENRREELLASDNIFCGLILAQLDMIASKRNYEDRAVRKLALMKAMSRRGMDPDHIREMLRFIDWLMKVPSEIYEPYYNEYVRLSEESGMPYVSSFEYFGKKKGIEIGKEIGEKSGEITGLKKGLNAIIRLRFAKAYAGFRKELKTVDDLAKLNRALDVAIKADSIEEVRNVLKS